MGLMIQSVKHQRGFPRTRNPGNDSQPVTDLHINILEVVLGRTANPNIHHYLAKLQPTALMKFALTGIPRLVLTGQQVKAGT
ncbi:MAG: hypothetical protein WCC94_09820, partial [Candidatus Bathyarchaeia archaeon]